MKRILFLLCLMFGSQVVPATDSTAVADLCKQLLEQKMASFAGGHYEGHKQYTAGCAADRLWKEICAHPDEAGRNEALQGLLAGLYAKVDAGDGERHQYCLSHTDVQRALISLTTLCYELMPDVVRDFALQAIDRAVAFGSKEEDGEPDYLALACICNMGLKPYRCWVGSELVEKPGIGADPAIQAHVATLIPTVVKRVCHPAPEELDQYYYVTKHLIEAIQGDDTTAAWLAQLPALQAAGSEGNPGAMETLYALECCKVASLRESAKLVIAAVRASRA